MSSIYFAIFFLHIKYTAKIKMYYIHHNPMINQTGHCVKTKQNKTKLLGQNILTEPKLALPKQYITFLIFYKRSVQQYVQHFAYYWYKADWSVIFLFPFLELLALCPTFIMSERSKKEAPNYYSQAASKCNWTSSWMKLK